MSYETIRDQATSVAMSLLKDRVLYIEYMYKKHNGQPSNPENSKLYIAKVTAGMAEKIRAIFARNTEIRDQNQAGSGLTLDEMAIQATLNLTIPESKPTPVQGVILNVNGAPALVNILTLKTYSELSNIGEPIGNLKYLLQVLDYTEVEEAERLERELIEATTLKLQKRFDENYARELLGDSVYQTLISDFKLDK